MKKTNKENPLTTFRKLNQARQGMVIKSLKKAQAGIQTNGDPEDMMINKPGSTGGYKKPSNPIIPPAGTRSAYGDYPKPDAAIQNSQRVIPTISRPTIPSPPNMRPRDIEMREREVSKQKKGGSVKRKK